MTAMVRKLALASLCSVAVVVALSACSSAKPAAQPGGDASTPPPSPPSHAPVVSPVAPASPRADVVTRLIEHALQSDGSVSYGQLVERLGAPRRVESRPIANAYHPRQIDTLRTLHYRGVEALVYDVSTGPKSFLIRFSLLTDRYVTPEGLRVGDPRARVLDRIGPPTERNPQAGEWIYQESDATPTAMIVTIDGQRIARIDWEFYFS